MYYTILYYTIPRSAWRPPGPPSGRLPPKCMEVCGAATPPSGESEGQQPPSEMRGSSPPAKSQFLETGRDVECDPNAHLEP